MAIRNYLIAASLVIGLASAIAGSYLSLDRRSRVNETAIEQLATGQSRIEAKLDHLIDAINKLNVRVVRIEERLASVQKQLEGLNTAW